MLSLLRCCPHTIQTAPPRIFTFTFWCVRAKRTMRIRWTTSLWSLWNRLLNQLNSSAYCLSIIWFARIWRWFDGTWEETALMRGTGWAAVVADCFPQPRRLIAKFVVIRLASSEWVTRECFAALCPSDKTANNGGWGSTEVVTVVWNSWYGYWCSCWRWLLWSWWFATGDEILGSSWFSPIVWRRTRKVTWKQWKTPEVLLNLSTNFLLFGLNKIICREWEDERGFYIEFSVWNWSSGLFILRRTMFKQVGRIYLKQGGLWFNCDFPSCLIISIRAYESSQLCWIWIKYFLLIQKKDIAIFAKLIQFCLVFLFPFLTTF